MFGFLKNILGGSLLNKGLRESLANQPFLVDVRTAAEFSSGTVKGAVNIPLNQISNQLTMLKNKKNIVVFCRSGNRSEQAKQILNINNIHQVTNGGTWRNVQLLLNEINQES